MAETSKIEWTDATWNPITGCSVVSPGCTNCYAMKLAGTRLQHHPSRKDLTTDSKAGPVWNGQVRLNEEWLTQPLKWKRPRMIFVCAHGDLFHESVPDKWIDRVFAVMALAPQHTFQVLTKRSKRMREYVNEVTRLRIADAALERDRGALTATGHWPLPNVWLGVSIEDQKRADERIPDLLDTPAAVRFVSAEPLLGPVDLGLVRGAGLLPSITYHDALEGARHDGEYHYIDDPRSGSRLDWVIVGGESGPGARPMHPDWARSLRDQCAAAGGPFLFKQWGANLPDNQMSDDCPYGSRLGDEPTGRFADKMAYWGVGPARAGRLLDGIEHNAMPEVQP